MIPPIAVPFEEAVSRILKVKPPADRVWIAQTSGDKVFTVSLNRRGGVKRRGWSAAIDEAENISRANDNAEIWIDDGLGVRRLSLRGPTH